MWECTLRSSNKRDIPVSVSSPVTAIPSILPGFPRETAPLRVFPLTELLPQPTVELCVQFTIRGIDITMTSLASWCQQDGLLSPDTVLWVRGSAVCLWKGFFYRLDWSSWSSPKQTGWRRNIVNWMTEILKNDWNIKKLHFQRRTKLISKW